MQTLQEKLSPILEEIHDLLMEHCVNAEAPEDWSNNDLRSAIKIFVQVVGDICFIKLSNNSGFTRKERLDNAHDFGSDICKLVLKHTGIHPHNLYKND